LNPLEIESIRFHWTILPCESPDKGRRSGRALLRCRGYPEEAAGRAVVQPHGHVVRERDVIGLMMLGLEKAPRPSLLSQALTSYPSRSNKLVPSKENRHQMRSNRAAKKREKT